MADYRIESLTRVESRWNVNNDFGTPVTLTYSFAEELPDYYNNSLWGVSDFRPFAEEMRVAARQILSAFEKLGGLRFEETAGSGTIQFMTYSGRAGIPQGIANDGEAFLPDSRGQHAGDVFLNHTSEQARDFGYGKDGFWLLAHEIGHTLGLKHPGNYSGFDEGVVLPADEDTRANTIMSYNDTQLSRLDGPYDELALTYLYGSSNVQGQSILGLETNASYFGDERIIEGTKYSEVIKLHDNSVIHTEIFGKGGFDTVSFTEMFNSSSQNYYIKSSDSTVSIGTGITLHDVERVEFNDGVLAFDSDGIAGQAYRLYQAAFARTPDTSGLAHNIRLMDAGMSLQQMAEAFIYSAEFEQKYGSNPTDSIYLEALYDNVLNREPDAVGLAYWLEKLASGEQDRSSILIGFSESLENQQLVAPYIDDGIWLGN